MENITLKNFIDYIATMIELVRADEHQLNYLEFSQLEDLVVENIPKFGDQISKSSIKKLVAAFKKNVPDFNISFTYYDRGIQPADKILSIIIYLKLINKIKLSIEDDRFGEAIVLCLKYPELSSTSKRINHLISTIRNYQDFYQEPLNYLESYDHETLTLPFYKLMFDLEHEYGYINRVYNGLMPSPRRPRPYTEKVYHICRLGECRHSDEAYNVKKLFPYALANKYKVQINSTTNYKNIEKLDTTFTRENIKEIVGSCFFHEKGCVRLDLMAKPNFLKEVLEQAEHMNETFLDKRLSFTKYMIGECEWWAWESNMNKYISPLKMIINHDLKVQSGVLNIHEKNIAFLLRLGLMPLNDDEFNIIVESGQQTTYQKTAVFDGLLKNHKRSSEKKLKETYKNVLLKSTKMRTWLKERIFHLGPSVPDNGYDKAISNFFLFKCFDTPDEKINFMLACIFSDIRYSKDFQGTILRECFGINVEYIEKNKQDFLKIPQKQRKQIYSVLAKKEKNIFKKVALKNCLAA